MITFALNISCVTDKNFSWHLYPILYVDVFERHYYFYI